MGTFSENFDGVTPPALPAGWMAFNATGAAPLWVTSNAGVPTPVADSLPNAAFIDDPAGVSDKWLHSPSLIIPSATAQLSFRNNYNLEASPPDYYDGGVLEISLNGGATFADILTAGGSFVSGGYNATISTGFSNPIAGRMAWSGNSGGFILTTVNLPAAANGQAVVFRWRMGSDTIVASQGWRIDTAQVFCNGGAPSPSPTATATASATPTPTSTLTPSPTPTPTPPCPSPTKIFLENFDGVTPPALPAGWVAANAIDPDAILWITSNAGTPAPAADSSPNAAFINDPSSISDKRLDSPPIAIVGPAQLFFRNNYALEPIEGGTFYFDGGVLEVSPPNINAGAFTDITDAAVGGSFVTGGYNGTISTAFSNPIAGRMAWSQNSGGFISTVANLGPNVAGQTIKLRWRMGSDSSVSATGWRIDNVSILDCLAAPTPTPTPTPSTTPMVAISGTVGQCTTAGPSGAALADATMILTGTSGGSTLTDASGNYSLSGLSGGTYTVTTPTKAARAPGSSGINTTDVIAVQRHFLILATPLSGCRRAAADVNASGTITTTDVIAIQRFFLALTTGIANVGKYSFNPVSRSYTPLTANQTGQNSDTIVFGDVASPFANPRPGGPPSDAP